MKVAFLWFDSLMFIKEDLVAKQKSNKFNLSNKNNLINKKNAGTKSIQIINSPFDFL
jgi:hypothetical protein